MKPAHDSSGCRVRADRRRCSSGRLCSDVSGHARRSSACHVLVAWFWPYADCGLRISADGRPPRVGSGRGVQFCGWARNNLSRFWYVLYGRIRKPGLGCAPGCFVSILGSAGCGTSPALSRAGFRNGGPLRSSFLSRPSRAFAGLGLNHFGVVLSVRFFGVSIG